ncbi:MAG: hypothetical protein DWQ06_03530 [Calditrichaeota bacterium]|nr:MAG: hypothetical protein DWQ06_03530 [Calditrichota bacterium]
MFNRKIKNTLQVSLILALAMTFGNAFAQTNNEFLGTNAGNSITTGNNNVAIGDEAGKKLKTGSDNTFLGTNSGRDQATKSGNVFMGYSIGASNQTADSLTLIGYGISQGVSNNTLIGQLAGVGQSGRDNVSAGSYAGWINNGSKNTCVGNSAGLLNSFGNDNVYLGYQANSSNSHFIENVSIGSQSSIDGSFSISIGKDADIVEKNSVSIGQNADISKESSISIGNSTIVSDTNSISIGNGTIVNSKNSVVIGNFSTISIGGIVNWSTTSDGRFKTNVRENIIGLDFINRLRPVSYNYQIEKLEKFYGKEIPESLKNSSREKEKIRYSGFIAQEVEKIKNELNFDFSGVDTPQNKNSQVYGLRYSEFVVPLVKAVQELSKKVESQNEEISILKEKQKIISPENTLLQEIQKKLIKLKDDSNQSLSNQIDS